MVSNFGSRVLALLVALLPVPSAMAAEQVTPYVCGNYSLALSGDGELRLWGGEEDYLSLNVPSPVVLPRPVVQVACGPRQWLALDDRGTLWEWAVWATGSPQPDVAATAVSGVAQIVQGHEYSVAVLEDGSVWMWGDTSSWGIEPSQDGGAVRVEALEGTRKVVASQFPVSGDQSLVAIGLDGSLREWDAYDAGNGEPPVELPISRSVVDVAVGYVHALALTDDGHVWGWGRENSHGQLGLGDREPQSVPKEIPGLSGVQAVAVTYSSSYALDEEGSIWRWGAIPTAVLDTGFWETSDQTTPVRFEGLTGVAAINANQGRIFAATVDGALWAWGRNEYGRLGDGTDEDQIDPVRVVGFGEDAPASPLPPAPHLSVDTAPGAVTLTVEADDLRNGLVLYYASYPDAGFVHVAYLDERASRFELPSGLAYYVGVAIGDMHAGVGISALSNVEHFVVP